MRVITAKHSRINNEKGFMLRMTQLSCLAALEPLSSTGFVK